MDVCVGAYHACAQLADASIWCWGDNRYGQLGNSAAGDLSSSPVEAQGLSTNTYRGLTCNANQTCVLEDGGTVWCWGSLVGTSNPQPTEPVTGIGNVDELLAGSSHICAKKTDGSLWCWGASTMGQLGLGYAGGIVASTALRTNYSCGNGVCEVGESIDSCSADCSQ